MKFTKLAHSNKDIHIIQYLSHFNIYVEHDTLERRVANKFDLFLPPCRSDRII